MNARTDSTPDALRLEEALKRSEPLARLRLRLQESKERFASIVPLLPALLVAHVEPGPVDDLGWSLIAANAAVAAKLRQLQPRLEAAIRAGGWHAVTIRVKIRSHDG